MELEISPRQSGKTTRLLEEVKRCLKHGKKVWIFTPNYNMASVLSKEINKFHPMTNKFSSNKVKISSATPESIVAQNLNGYKVFCDEFDFYDKDFWQLFNINGVNLKNAYFCTTPKKLRTIKEFVKRKTNDPLIKLLRKNRHNYTSHPMFNGEVSKRQFFNNVLSIDAYLNEAEGIFVK